MRPWTLAIDFGTSYTVAAARIEERSPEVIEIGGDRRMPSVVLIDATGHTVVGRIAEDLSSTHPESTLRAIKNRIGDQAPVVLDGRPRQVVHLVAALLQHVYEDAVRQMGGPPTEVRLTHPATWMRPWLNRLVEAAAKAGIENVVLVPEPVAAALSFATEVGVRPGAHVAVYDLGGGTFDSAVVTATETGFTIIGRPNGDQSIGGELFDELIVNHLGEQLPEDVWEQIQLAEDATWQQVGASLRNEARKAKETLSGNAYALLILPLPAGMRQLRLDRDEFEELVEPFLQQTTDILRRCVDDARVAVEELQGIALVGGSSRSPIVERTVKAAFPSVPVVRRGDPKTAVATGATRAERSTAEPPARPGQRTTKEHVSRPPSSPSTPSPPGPTPVPAGGPSNPPSPAGPTSHEGAVAGASSPPTPPYPVGGAPVVPGAAAGAIAAAAGTGATTGTPSAPARAVGPVAGGAVAGVPVASTGRRPHRRSPSGTTKAAVALAVAGVLIGLLLVVLALRSNSGGAAPSDEEMAGLLLPEDEVLGALGEGWEPATVSTSDIDFCEELLPTEDPEVESEQIFSVEDTSGATEVFDTYHEALRGYSSASDAEASFAADRRFFDECDPPNDVFGDASQTVTLEDVTTDFDDLASDVVAARFHATSADDKTTWTWLIAERLVENVVVRSSYLSNDAELGSDELDAFHDLTGDAFRHVEEEL